MAHHGIHPAPANPGFLTGLRNGLLLCLPFWAGAAWFLLR